MAKINLKTTKQVVPTIYSYSTPEIKRHEGWTKIGYTEKEVEKRLKQQTHTADIEYKLEWSGNAVFEGSGDTFTDKDFHLYLKKNDVESMEDKNNEWFHIDGHTGRNMFYDFRNNRGEIKAVDTAISYKLRNEQNEAVNGAVSYFNSHNNGEFLWNAKPRFGKTLSTYDMCKKLGAKYVLVVTNRPAIANSWYKDYVTFLGDESGYKFVSSIDAIKDQKHVISREQFCQKALLEDYGCIEFLSLQDIKGSRYFGGKFDKLEYVANVNWDVLVIDEAHEGVDTYKTDVAFERINRKHTLHLSGTPFKALSNDKFNSDAIYNWTYVDEQRAKKNWRDEDGENPYANLPDVSMFTYKMSDIISDELSQGIDINGETEEYAFDLNEFFKVNENGAFIHNSAVDKFLDAMVSQEKFPFSTEELRNEIKHSFWLLDRVDSAKALARKLNAHSVFKDYEVVIAAGDGRLDEEHALEKSFDKVVKAIAENDKTITLSVGQLTTGVTIPEWTAVMMLSNVKSPSLYMQTAFRAQNPCLFHENGRQYRKQTAYIFDFDPARTLIIYESFANDLSSNTANGKGDSETRKEQVKELLNFFPVIGEDENGEMIELDAEKVLSIPRKIKSEEVVKRGFMSNFLFQNISNIFGAPQEVIDIITNLPATKEPEDSISNAQKELSLNDKNEVEISPEKIIGISSGIFGDKIYMTEDISDIISTAITEETPKEEELDDLYQKISETVTDTVESIVGEAKSHYGSDLNPALQKKIEKDIKTRATTELKKATTHFEIDSAELAKRRDEALDNMAELKKSAEEIQNEFQKKQKELADAFKEKISESYNNIIEDAAKSVVKTVEEKKMEKKKNTVEEGFRNHLRGFSRTIPSFLMGYGDDTVTLATFDEIVPENVFLDVTSITIDQFRFLRDGGKYIEEETGEEKYFEGNLFDPVVFDDSVKEFLRLKKKLANYFDEEAVEDIFNYIPPQKTNQIYTPREVVNNMVDMLEEENPGCFDSDTNTFFDGYMKSGMYITEIVKRLYRSELLKKKYPDKEKRLQHIFSKQVFGLAPTEIIYKISTNYILGFNEDVDIVDHNFKLLDAVPLSKDGTLADELVKLFGEKLGKEGI